MGNAACCEKTAPDSKEVRDDDPMFIHEDGPIFSAGRKESEPSPKISSESSKAKASSKASINLPGTEWVRNISRFTDVSNQVDDDSTTASATDLPKELGKGQEVLDDDEANIADMSQCLKRSALVNVMLPFLAVDNPDNINNVYTFDKDVLSNGHGTGVSRKATVKVTGAVRSVKFVPQTLEKRKMDVIRSSVGVASTFDHPNLMSVHEIFEDQDYMYLVMSFCPGGSLEMRLKQGTLSEVKAVIVMRQVFHALFYLHVNKIIHRDVKPSNIFFNSSADEIVPSSLVRVSSFGTACKKIKGHRLARDIGTPGYMAPDMSSDVYSYPVDLWSCGVVMFEILCGRLPFPSNSQVSGNMQINYLPQDQNVSKQARDFISLLVDGDPKARYNIKQSLQHKWLDKGLAKLIAVPFNATTLVNLRAFRNLTPFQSAAMRIISQRLSDKETANCRMLFIYLDRDGDGNLVPDELENIIAQDPKIKAAFPDVSDIFQQIDHHNDSRSQAAFTYTEFVAATFDREQCLTDNACRAAFRCFDKDGDGYISMNELCEGHLLGEVSLSKLNQIFKDADDNGDDQLDFSEFVAALKKS